MPSSSVGLGQDIHDHHVRAVTFVRRCCKRRQLLVFVIASRLCTIATKFSLGTCCFDHCSETGHHVVQLRVSLFVARVRRPLRSALAAVSPNSTIGCFARERVARQASQLWHFVVEAGKWNLVRGKGASWTPSSCAWFGARERERFKLDRCAATVRNSGNKPVMCGPRFGLHSS